MFLISYGGEFGAEPGESCGDFVGGEPAFAATGWPRAGCGVAWWLGGALGFDGGEEGLDRGEKGGVGLVLCHVFWLRVIFWREKW